MDTEIILDSLAFLGRSHAFVMRKALFASRERGDPEMLRLACAENHEWLVENTSHISDDDLVDAVRIALENQHWRIVYALRPGLRLGGRFPLRMAWQETIILDRFNRIWRHAMSFVDHCASGDLVSVEAYLSASGSRDPQHHLLIRWAIRKGFSRACYYGNIAIVKRLISHPEIDINRGLRQAVIRGQTSIVEYLPQEKWRPDVIDACFVSACQRSNMSLAQLFLQKGATRFTDALLRVCNQDWLRGVDFLLAHHKYDPNFLGRVIAYEIVRNGIHSETIRQRLFDAGANLVETVSEHYSDATFDWIMKHSAELTILEWNVLFLIVCKKGSLDHLRVLCAVGAPELGAAIISEGQRHADRRGARDIVAYLLTLP